MNVLVLFMDIVAALNEGSGVLHLAEVLDMHSAGWLSCGPDLHCRKVIQSAIPMPLGDLLYGRGVMHWSDNLSRTCEPMQGGSAYLI